MGIGDILSDKITSHSVDLMRLEEGARKIALRYLVALEKELVNQLRLIDPTGVEAITYKNLRIAKLLDQTRVTIDSAYSALRRELKNELVDLAVLESQFTVSGLNTAIGAEVATVGVTRAALSTIVTKQLIQGEVLSGWMQGLAVNTRRRLQREMAKGALAGEPLSVLVNRIRGTPIAGRPGKYAGGFMSISKREAEALARTSIQTIANKVREQTLKDNDSLIKGMQAQVTLDLSTTDLCKSRAKMAWDLNGNPLPGTNTTIHYPGPPPWHWNCFIDGQVPIYTSKGWKPIGKLKAGELVLTHAGRFKPITEIFTTPNQKPEVVKIGFNSLINASKSLTVTKDHPILINGKWENAGKIEVGDKVTFLANKCENCGELVPYYNKYCNSDCSNNVTNKIPWEEERRARVSKSAREQMISEYGNGTRDAFKITKAANKESRRLVKAGLHVFQRKEVGRKSRAVKWSKKINRVEQSVRMTRHNPAYKIKGKKRYPEEQLLKNMLDFLKLDYREQFKIGRFKVDFLIIKYGVVIECDGNSKNLKGRRERLRQEFIESRGYTFMRFTTSELINSSGSVLREVASILQNHSGNYEFMQVEATSVDRWVPKKCKTLYNFAVETDESYIAKGFVVHNCRTTLIPVLKSLQELGARTKARIPTSTQSSMDGQVSEGLTYEEWLKTKSVAEQKDALGVRKQQLWAEGKIKNFRQLVDQTGRPLTVSELEAKYA